MFGIFKKKQAKEMEDRQKLREELYATIKANMKPISESHIRYASKRANLPTGMYAGDVPVTKFSPSRFKVVIIIQSLSHLGRDQVNDLTNQFFEVLSISQQHDLLDHLFKISGRTTTDLD